MVFVRSIRKKQPLVRHLPVHTTSDNPQFAEAETITFALVHNVRMKHKRMVPDTERKKTVVQVHVATLGTVRTDAIGKEDPISAKAMATFWHQVDRGLQKAIAYDGDPDVPRVRPKDLAKYRADVESLLDVIASN
jgi:hypothetical protein